jgi:hypothetical protein
MGLPVPADRTPGVTGLAGMARRASRRTGEPPLPQTQVVPGLNLEGAIPLLVSNQHVALPVRVVDQRRLHPVCCPVTGNMPFDRHLVVSHVVVVVTAIMLSALCDSLQHHAGGCSQSTPLQRAVSRPAAAAASAAPSRDTYAFVRGNVRSDV